MHSFHHRRMLSEHPFYREDIGKNSMLSYGFSRNPSGERTEWFGTDSQENLRKNTTIPERRAMLVSDGWMDRKISYCFNDFGFRSPDNYGDDLAKGNPIFIGGSTTEAIGINITDSWGYILSRNIDAKKFVNLGQSSGGIETVYRLLHAWVPVIRPSAVYYLPTPEPRREFVIAEKKTRVVTAWNNTRHEVDLMFHDLEINLAVRRTYDAMVELCRRYGASILTPTRSAIEIADELNKGKFARDLIHPGEIWHRTLASDHTFWQQLVFLK